MLRTRLWMGAVLIALASGVLIADEYLPPGYPFLFIFILALALAACHELLQLIGSAIRLPAWLCHACVAVVLVANWPAHVFDLSSAWMWVAGTFAAAVLSSFLAEMATFREPGGSLLRIALVVFVTAY